MIIIHNFVTLSKYLMNYFYRSKNTFHIEYEYLEEDEMDDESVCYCSPCVICRSILAFPIRYLKLKKM